MTSREYEPALIRALTATSASIITVAFILKFLGKQPSGPSPARKIIASPRTTLLPGLTPAQKSALGYPPDALPGARDVETPYGSMRVYEWGPESGKKVICIHGDATAAPLFGPLANQLVAKGCRVMCIDLYGRGYSDTPSGTPHNSHLYTQQIHYAISSSSIKWTGTQNGSPIRFSLIGFSLGGAIVLDFFSHHPAMINELVLLGPAGLLRKLPAEYLDAGLRNPSTSKSELRRLVGILLGVESTSKSTTDRKYKGFTPAGALQFQFDHHQGHIESMISTLKHAPIQNQESLYRRACNIISGKTAIPNSSSIPLYNGKILVVVGKDDPVIPPSDTEADLKKYLGSTRHYDLKVLPGNHGFPFPQGAALGDLISSAWGLKGSGGSSSHEHHHHHYSNGGEEEEDFQTDENFDEFGNGSSSVSTGGSGTSSGYVKEFHTDGGDGGSGFSREFHSESSSRGGSRSTSYSSSFQSSSTSSTSSGSESRSGGSGGTKHVHEITRGGESGDEEGFGI